MPRQNPDVDGHTHQRPFTPNRPEHVMSETPSIANLLDLADRRLDRLLTQTITLPTHFPLRPQAHPAVWPFIFQNREPVEFTALEEDLGAGFVRKVFLHGVRARFRITNG